MTRIDCHPDLAVRVRSGRSPGSILVRCRYGDVLVIMMTFRHTAHFRLGPRGRRNACLDLINNKHLLSCLIGISAGLYVYSSAAFAEVEEETNQDEGKSSYSITALSHGTIANFSFDNFTNIDNQSELTWSKELNRFDEALIPEAVWALDANMEARPGRISGGVGSQTYTVFGGGLESMGFWTNEIVDFRDEKTRYSLLPPQFQVASCGGSSSEHSDLDYCTNMDNNSDHDVGNANTSQRDSNSNTSTGSDTDSSVNSSSIAPSPSPISQPSFAPFISPLPSMSLQGDLTLQDPCNAASGSCLSTVTVDESAIQFSLETTAQFSSTTTAPALVTVSVPISGPPSDSPTPSIGDLAPPSDSPPPQVTTPPISVDAPGPGSDWPLDVTPPSQRPIPEASTWTMTVIGFSVVVFIFGTKRKNRVNPISIIDISEGY